MFERRPTEQARERITGARQRLFELRRALEAELLRARAFQSADYSAEGLAKHRGELADRARAKYAPQLEQIQAQVRYDAETIDRWASARRPKLSDDAVTLQRAQMRWDGVRQRLDAGMPMRQVLAGADLDTVLAIQEWGPAYLEAQAYSARDKSAAFAPPNPEGLSSAITARLLEVADADTRWALAAQQDAATAVGGFAPLAEHASTLLDPTAPPRDALEAAVASHYGAQSGQASLDALAPGSDSEGGEAA